MADIGSRVKAWRYFCIESVLNPDSTPERNLSPQADIYPGLALTAVNRRNLSVHCLQADTDSDVSGNLIRQSTVNRFVIAYFTAVEIFAGGDRLCSTNNLN
ncbi:hypothetical protein OMR58_20525 [Erwinia sp. INIA-01]|uniref:hypothetical protein n=1 Tax=Erwinia sp. INIA01 TaxID=2991500 RepID=UPI0022257EDD|nr:hypothetical protein [Erwinia sp. INIA01]MCW1876837.1 hypothetical protein [Erwinia sp. INIA01]